MEGAYNPVLFNFIYAVMGGVLTLLFMWLGCKLFNKTVSFSMPKELEKGNHAVEMMVMGMFIGIGTAMGLVIGLGLN